MLSGRKIHKKVKDEKTIDIQCTIYKYQSLLAYYAYSAPAVS